MINNNKIIVLLLCLTVALTACGFSPYQKDKTARAILTPTTSTHEVLISLPEPKGKIVVSVYNFRDQTGQYKPQSGASSFSTAVTQGATSMLLKALKDSKWFIPVEREGLQDLLTERKIIRAAIKNTDTGGNTEMSPLMYSSLLLEGGIVGYDTNIVTGGFGAKYFGVGASGQYRLDQVTIYLRAVDIRTGRILNSVSTTKTIMSKEVRAGLFRFVSFKRLLEIETGYTKNEPAQLCVVEAIEKAVTSLVIEGVLDNTWAFKKSTDIQSEVIQNYLQEKSKQQIDLEVAVESVEEDF